MAAKREFAEELGVPPPEGKLVELGQAKQSSSKIVQVWACTGDLNVAHIRSNLVSIEWPPKSGKQQKFPEVDRAAWTSLPIAREKLVKGQAVFITRLAEQLGLNVPEPPTQPSLF